jgi:hypothetical protein
MRLTGNALLGPWLRSGWQAFLTNIFLEAPAIGESRKNRLILSLIRIQVHIGPIRTTPCHLRRQFPVWR